MIISAKSYTLKKMELQNFRTNGKNKAIETKSYKEAYTYTLTKREKGKKKYIYIYIYIYISVYTEKGREQPIQ